MWLAIPATFTSTLERSTKRDVDRTVCRLSSPPRSCACPGTLLRACIDSWARNLGSHRRRKTTRQRTRPHLINRCTSVPHAQSQAHWPGCFVRILVTLRGSFFRRVWRSASPLRTKGFPLLGLLARNGLSGARGRNPQSKVPTPGEGGSQEPPFFFAGRNGGPSQPFS